MDVVHFMNALNGQDHFSDINLGLVFWKNVLFDEEIHHVAPREILHDQIEIMLVFEAGVQFGDPIGGRLSKQTFLCIQMLDLVLENHVCFLHFLHCDVLVGGSSTQPDFAKGSSADDFDGKEVPRRNSLALDAHEFGMAFEEMLGEEVLLVGRQIRELHFLLQLQEAVLFFLLLLEERAVLFLLENARCSFS